MTAFNSMLAWVSGSFNDLGSESVSWTPPGSITPITIQALVERNPPELYAGSSEIRTWKMRIDVLNSATLGVDGTTSPKGGKFVVSLLPGGTDTVTYTVTDDSISSPGPGRIAFTF